MVSFEIFVKAMPPSLSELKVLPSFCFAFKIPDDRAVTIIHQLHIFAQWGILRTRGCSIYKNKSFFSFKSLCYSVMFSDN